MFFQEARGHFAGNRRFLNLRSVWKKLTCGVSHTMHAVNQGNKRIVVLSTDTDVFVLLVYMYYWRELMTEGLEELWMKAGVGNSTRFIPIHILSLRIGPGLCKVLPSIHMLTGCDYTSKVGTKLAALTTNPETHLG